MGKKHLPTAERLWLAGEIQRLIAIASDATRPESKWADNLVRNAYLWYWTADGISAKGKVTRDLLKMDVEFLRHTEKARAALQEGRRRDVMHEHAVPRKILLDHLKQEGLNSPLEIKEFLDQFCIGVLIEKAAEAPKLKPWESTMPSPFSTESNPLERYEAAELKVLDPKNPRLD
jgi:hypothetical protein